MYLRLTDQSKSDYPGSLHTECREQQPELLSSSTSSHRQESPQTSATFRTHMLVYISILKSCHNNDN